MRLHGAGTKHFHHTEVGELELAYESVNMVSEPGLTLTIYAAEPASRTADALALLAAWSAVAASRGTSQSGGQVQHQERPSQQRSGATPGP